MERIQEERETSFCHLFFNLSSHSVASKKLKTTDLNDKIQVSSQVIHQHIESRTIINACVL